METIEELRDRVEAAAASIRANPPVFVKVREFLRRRAEACIANRGLHFEQFL